MTVEFPIFVLAKDCGEVQRFASIYELQKQLEEIDVENAEYLAWDKHGRPVSLGVQQPVWLKLESKADLQQLELEAALEKYAAALGLNVHVDEASPAEFNQAFEQIESEVKRHTRPSLFRRLIRRA